MKNRWTRVTALAAMLGLGASTFGCGYILYPERRGSRGGYIAGGTLAMDLLWLLPGIIPGVVALVVDFSSGSIYVGGGYAVSAASDGTIAIRLPDATTPQQLELRLVTASRRVVARTRVALGPAAHDQWVKLAPDDAARTSHEPYYFEVVSTNGASARLATAFAAK